MVIDGDVKQRAVRDDEQVRLIPRIVSFSVIVAVVVRQEGIDQPLRLANAERVGRREHLDRACDPRLEDFHSWWLVSEGIHRVKKITLEVVTDDLGCALW